MCVCVYIYIYIYERTLPFIHEKALFLHFIF